LPDTTVELVTTTVVVTDVGGLTDVVNVEVGGGVEAAVEDKEKGKRLEKDVNLLLV